MESSKHLRPRQSEDEFESIRSEVWALETQLAELESNLSHFLARVHERLGSLVGELDLPVLAPAAFPICQAETPLKQLYREAVRKIHPDRAEDESGRQLRNALMARVNLAYRQNDPAQIREALREIRREQALPADAQSKEERLAIEALRARRGELASRIEMIASSDSNRFRLRIEAEEALGRNPLDTLSALLRANKAPSEPPGHPAPASTGHKIGDYESLRGERSNSTRRGEHVRGATRAAIADLLNGRGIEYRYEHPVVGTRSPGICRPDFTCFDASGRILVWEHVSPTAGWDERCAWFCDNGWILGMNLFTTRDGMTAAEFETAADYFRSLVIR